MSRLPTLLSFALLLLAPIRSSEAIEVLRLDPEATEVTFHLGATGHDVEGQLFLRDGEVRLDPETHRAEGTIVLDARRTESGNDKRDRKMHEEVLVSEKHPWIVFRLESFEGDVEKGGPVKFLGEVELLGRKHPVTLDATVEHRDETFTVEGRVPVPFVAWGLEDPSILFLRVEKVVEVRVDAEGTSTHEEGVAEPAVVVSEAPGR